MESEMDAQMMQLLDIDIGLCRSLGADFL